MTNRLASYEEVGYRHGVEMRAQAPSMIPVLRQELAAALNVTPEHAVAMTLACYARRLESLPSLREYPELRGMDDCLAAYNRGLGRGTQLQPEHVVLMVNYRYMMQTQRAQPELASTHPDPAGGCTHVFFPRSDRGPLVANNNDGIASHQHRSPPGWIVSNRAGLLVGTVSSGVWDDEVSPEQFPAPVFLLADECCATCDEAVDLLTRLNHFWGPCNALIADRQGRSAVMEKTACRVAVRPSNNGFAWTTEMAAEDPQLSEYLWSTRERSLTQRGLDHDSPDWAYWQAAQRRSQRLGRLVREAQADPTFQALQAIIYDHTGEPEQIHMDGSRCHPLQGEGEWTLRTTIWVLDERQAQVSYAQPPISSHLTPRQWIDYSDVSFVF